eukprot:gene13505-13620_t
MFSLETLYWILALALGLPLYALQHAFLMLKSLALNCSVIIFCMVTYFARHQGLLLERFLMS